MIKGFSFKTTNKSNTKTLKKFFFSVFVVDSTSKKHKKIPFPSPHQQKLILFYFLKQHKNLIKILKGKSFHGLSGEMNITV